VGITILGSKFAFILSTGLVETADSKFTTTDISLLHLLQLYLFSPFKSMLILNVQIA
jgi:hypothetical protein